VFLVAFAWTTSEAHAQTTGTVKGIVIDEGGLSIPGVLVTLSSESLIGGAQQHSTDGSGRFLFTQLPPGTYLVKFEKPGFTRLEKPNIRVLIGRSVNLTIELPTEVAGEEYIVEESRPTLDTESVATGQVLQKEFLEKVPTGRSYQSVVSATPGVIGGGNPNIAGGSYNENTYLLDGVQITDPVTGTFSLNFNFDAIEQIEVLTGAFDPEYPQSLGGIVNIVTETGTNQLEFDTNFWYESSLLSPKYDARYAADGAELAPTGFDSSISNLSMNAKVSGPIVRDRAWFIISYSRVRTQYANVGIDLPRDYEGHYILAKLTAQPNPSHRFQAMVQADPTTVDNLDQYDRFVRPEAQYRQAQGGLLGSFTWDWFISPEIYVETVASAQQSYIDVSGVPCTHDTDLGYHPCDEDEPENSLDFITPGRYGSYNAFDSDNYPYIYIDERMRAQVDVKLSVLQREFIGFHDLKTGVQVSTVSWENVVGYTGNHYYVDANLVTYDPETYTNWYWVESTAPYHLKQTGKTFGAFIQDVWKPVDNLTFRYGVRYDRTIYQSDTQDRIINASVWGPRFYAAWDPWGDEKTKFYGGYGRFNDLGNLGIASYQSDAGFGYKLYFGELYGNYTSPANELAAEYEYENTFTSLDELDAPHTDEFVLGAQRELIQDVVLGVGFKAKFLRNYYAYDETNNIWDEDGYNTLGSTDGTGFSFLRLRTPEVSRRDYYQTDLFIEKDWSDRWLMGLTYSYVVSKGTSQGNTGAGLAVPPQFELTYGNLYSDIRHQVKGYAAVDLPNDPWTTTLGVQLQFYSGSPATRYYYTPATTDIAFQLKSPVGSYGRTEPVFYLDLFLSQDIHVRKGELSANLIITNILNMQQGDAVDTTLGSGEPRWFIYDRQQPLTFSGGLQYKF